MDSKGIEIIEMLLSISERRIITKEYKVIFLELIEEFLENIRGAENANFKKSDMLLPLWSWQIEISNSAQTNDIKDFKSILAGCFENTAESIFGSPNSPDFEKQIKALVGTVSVLENYKGAAISSIKTKIFEELVEMQSHVLSEIEQIFLSNAKSPGASGLLSPDLKLIYKSLIVASKKNERLLKNIVHEQDISDNQIDALVSLRTRRAVQNLLLEGNPKSFLDFLISKQSRNSKGKCQALKVANVYVEMTLDRISDGQRTTKRIGHYVRKHKHKSLYGHAFRTIPKDSFIANTKPMLRAMQLNVQAKPGLKVTDKELRRVCEQRIEHAIIKRRFSFKARPKHFNYTDAAQSMRDLRKTLDKAGVDFFLMSGTLLGAVREKGFIASDYDIDIGVFDSQADIPLLYEICENSPLFSIDEVVEDAIVKVKHVSGIVIDLFIYFEIEGLQCHRGGVHEWYNSDFGLTEIDFLGGRYYIPENYKVWLSENYGNWEKPVLFYDMSYDTPNRDYVSSSTRGIYYLQDRVTNALRKNWNNFIFMGVTALRREFGIDLTSHLLPAIRRKDKIEPPETRFEAEQISTILVGYFDGISEKHLGVIQELSKSAGICLAAVCDARPGSSDEYVLIENSFAERCKTAGAIKCVDGVLSAKTWKKLRNIRSTYSAASVIYLDEISALNETSELG